MQGSPDEALDSIATWSRAYESVQGVLCAQIPLSERPTLAAQEALRPRNPVSLHASVACVVLELCSGTRSAIGPCWGVCYLARDGKRFCSGGEMTQIRPWHFPIEGLSRDPGRRPISRATIYIYLWPCISWIATWPQALHHYIRCNTGASQNEAPQSYNVAGAQWL